MIEWKCPNCWTEYEIDEKYAEILKEKKDCKFCVRKDPNIPTTAEMDGLLTQEDMRLSDQIVVQCFQCARWTQQTHGKEYTPCTGIIQGQQYVDGRGKIVPGCGKTNYDSSSMKSLRTYNKDTDNKRKPKIQKKKR